MSAGRPPPASQHSRSVRSCSREAKRCSILYLLGQCSGRGPARFARRHRKRSHAKNDGFRVALCAIHTPTQFCLRPVCVVGALRPWANNTSIHSVTQTLPMRVVLRNLRKLPCLRAGCVAGAGAAPRHGGRDSPCHIHNLKQPLLRAVRSRLAGASADKPEGRYGPYHDRRAESFAAVFGERQLLWVRRRRRAVIMSSRIA